MSSLLTTLASLLPLPTSLLSNYTLTSLNALFFYLTWLTLVLSHSPTKISILSTVLVRLLCFWLPALGMTAFDLLLPGLAAGCKYHPSSVSMLPGTAPWLLLRAAANDLLGVGLHAVVVYNKPNLFPVSYALPLLPTIIYDLLLSQFVSSTLYYYLHRFLHSTSLGRKLHGQHHCHPPTALLARAQSPVDYLLLSVLPTYVVPVLRRSHVITWLCVLGVQCTVDVVRFSGYEGMWGLAGGLGRRTEEHYVNRGTCYFGIWGILDYIHGTSPQSLESDLSRATHATPSLRTSTTTSAARKAKKEWEEKWEKPLPDVPMPVKAVRRRGRLVKAIPNATNSSPVRGRAVGAGGSGSKGRAVSTSGRMEVERDEGVGTRSRRRKAEGS